METRHIAEELHLRFAAVRRRQDVAAILTGSAFAGTVFLLALLAALLLEDLFSLDVAPRTTAFWALCACAACLTAWYIIRPAGRLAGILPGASDHTTAAAIGRAIPALRDRLVNGWELATDETVESFSSRDLLDASLEDLRRTIDGMDFGSTVTFGRSRRMGTFLAVTASAAVLLFVLFPTSFFGAADRLFHYNEAFASPAPFRFIVDPGDKEVVKGETVPLRVRIEGEIPDRIVLAIRPSGQESADERELLRGSDGNFHAEFASLKSTLQYELHARGVHSSLYTLTVRDRPAVRSLRVLLTPPAYTRLPERTQDDNIGDVTALRGTQIRCSIESTKDLRDAAMVFSDSVTLPMAVTGRRAAVPFTLLKERTYHIILHDIEGTSSVDPVEYRMQIVPDAYPTVVIPIPGMNLDVTDNTSLDMVIKAGDDYGFSRLVLRYRLVQSQYEKAREEFTEVSIPIPAGTGTDAVIPYRWDLRNLHLVPEDMVSYNAEVFDNDVVSGPKSAISETFTLRLPSLDEVFADVEKQHDAGVDRMTEALRQAEEARKDLDDVRREMQQNQQKLGWEEKEKTSQALKKYEEARTAMDEVQRKVEQMTAEMQKNNVLSRETLEKYEELQRLMDQLAGPEFAEVMKKLQEAMQQMSPEAMKQALQQFSFSEENFRKSIERTLNLLKRIHIEQKMDEAVRRADEMLKRQEALQEQTKQASQSNPDEMQKLAQEQRELEKNAAALEKEVAGLKSAMEEFPSEMPLADMEQASRELEQSGLEQQMEDIARDLQQMQAQPASDRQQRAAGAMKNVGKQLRQAQDALRQNQQRQVLNAMRRAMQDILDLSGKEEALKKETEGLDPNSQQFRDNASEQMNVLRDLQSVTQNMSGLSQKTFSVTPEMGKSLGDAMRAMSEAMAGLDTRNRAVASERQEDAMGLLNEAAQQIQGAMDAMAQGGGQGQGMAGLMQRLQRMAAQQQGINDGTKNAGGMTPAQAAAMARLAGEEGIVRKSLEKLAKEAAASGELSKLLGDLNRTAQEMREVQTDLAGGNLTPETTRKEERILSRLLDAQRSTRERDFENERRSTAGKTVVQPSPAAIDLTSQEGRNRLRRDLQKTLEEGYTRDYEELIKRYFEVLEQYEAGSGQPPR